MSPSISHQTLSMTTKAREQNGKLHALLFTISVWLLLRPLPATTSKMQEMGPTVYSPYPRRPERLTICMQILITKAARSPHLYTVKLNLSVKLPLYSFHAIFTHLLYQLGNGGINKTKKTK